MADQPTLTLAFLTHAPQSAAQVLEEIEPHEASLFLEEVPVRIAAPVVGYMSPWSAARCVASLPADRAAAVLQNLHFHDCAGLVRLVAASRRAAILEALPARLARRLRNALTYPAGSVGAWIDPEIPAFQDKATVAEVTRYLINGPAASHIFVTSEDDGRFAGAVPVSALMRSQPARPIAELQWLRIKPLSSRAMLASVAFLPDWDDFLMLPVIGRNQSLVGGLTRAGLRKGMHEHHAVHETIPGTLTGHMLAAFAAACAGLLRAATQAEPERRNNA